MHHHSRRHFLTRLSAAGAAGVLGAGPAFADEGPPEITTVRLVKQTRYLHRAAVSGQGPAAGGRFTDVRYVEMPVAPAKMVGLGDVDFGMSMAPSIIFHQDAGLPIVALAGVHPGCWELFAGPTIRTIGDLKGKTVDVPTAWLERAPIHGHHGEACRARPRQGRKLVTNPIPDVMSMFAKARPMRSLYLRPKPRTCMLGMLAG